MSNSQPASLNTKLSRFGTSLKGGNAAEVRAAAVEVFREYGTLKDSVRAGRVDRKLAKALDDELIRMIRDAWTAVATRTGAADLVIPIGSFGRTGGAKYVPFLSDKDITPIGRNPRQALLEFARLFQHDHNLDHAALDIHALDPSDARSMAGRIGASWHPEKYRTLGGLTVMEHDLWQKNPSLWVLDPRATGFGQPEVPYQRWRPNPPPAPTAANALGYFSDNTRFIAMLRQEAMHDPAKPWTMTQQIAAEAKYHLRNLHACELAVGRLTAEQQAIRTLLGQLSKNARNLPDLLTDYARATGATGNGLKHLVGAIDGFTELAGRELADRHLRLLATTGDQASAALLREELGAAILNLRSHPHLLQKVEPGLGQAVAAGGEALATAEAKVAAWQAAARYADTLKTAGRQAFSERFFELAAHRRFAKPYANLLRDEVLLLHGGVEPPPGFWSQLGTAAGQTVKAGVGLAVVGISLYGVYDSYRSEYRASGSIGRAGAALLARAALDVAALMNPHLAVSEVLARLSLAPLGMLIEAQHQGALDDLYRRYTTGERLDDMLGLDVGAGIAAALRAHKIQLRAEWEKQHRTFTEADLDQAADAAIRAYLEHRRMHERSATALAGWAAAAERWLRDNDLGLLPGGRFADNATLDADEYQQRLAHLMALWFDLGERFRRDGIPDPEGNAWFYLRELYRDPHGFVAGVDQLYLTLLERTPAFRSPRVIAAAAGARLLRAKPPGGRGVPVADAALVAQGGHFQAHGPPCDPGVRLGPFAVPGAGRLRAHIRGEPPVPNVWSLGNWNVSLGVTFERRRGTNWEGAAELVALRGQLNANDLTGEGAWDGPGRLWVEVGPPGGHGPLNGGCFEQSWQASVTFIDWLPDNRPVVGDQLMPGDLLQSAADGGTALQLVDGSRVLLKPDSRVRVLEPARGRVRIVVERGGIVFQRVAKYSRGVEVQVGRRVVSPHGTLFHLEADQAGELAEVRVLEGLVLVSGPQRERWLIGPNARLRLPAAMLEAFEPGPNDWPRIDALSLAELPVGAPAPLPAGRYAARFADDELAPSGWRLHDPGGDAVAGTFAPDTLRLTVPHGNDFWRHEGRAPRLLHPVSGDFDLELALRVETRATDMVKCEFLAQAPGSYAGFLAGQFVDGLPWADCRILGNGAYVFPAGRRLPLLHRDLAQGVVLPDDFVRLRLTRRGDLWKGWWSKDNGATWNIGLRQRLTLPDALWVGLVFARFAHDGQVAEPGIFHLRDLVLDLPGRSQQAFWDLACQYGQAEIQGSGCRIELPGDRAAPGDGLGEVRGWLSRSIAGDFDAVFRMDLDDWPADAERHRAASIFVADNDAQRIFYIGRANPAGQPARVQTDCLPPAGGSYQWQPSTARRLYLRLRRQGAQVETHHWVGDRWERLDRFRVGLTGEVWLGCWVDNRWQVTRGAPVAAGFQLEHLIEGPDLGSGQTWRPPP